MYQIEIENDGVTEILHEPDAGSLRRVKACKFTDDVQAVPSAEITIYPQNPAFENLHELTTCVRIINMITKKTEFDGRVLQIPDSSMDSSGIISKKITCEGVLGYLCDSIQLYHVYQNVTVYTFLRALADNHNAHFQDSEKQIVRIIDGVGGFGTFITQGRTTLEEIRQNLLSVFGGEIRFQRDENGGLILHYAQKFGSVKSTAVELAKNLKSISAGTDVTSIITRLYPLGARLGNDSEERLTIASVNDGLAFLDDENAIAAYGIVCGVYTFDDITDPAVLLESGKEYLKQCNQIKKSYKATVLDLSTIGKDAHSLEAGNTYHFINPLLKLDENLRLLKRTVDIFRPFAPDVEIGDKMEKITDIAVQTRNYIQYEAPKQKYEVLELARENTTALLTHATKGYIYIDNELGELLIMDTPDKTTAQEVWRWNSSGFGYSNQGYDDGYFIAMTKDGGFIADRITSGTITGIEFNNGNGTFKVTSSGEVTASAITITGGKINISTDDENYDAIALRCQYEGARRLAEFTPLGLHVTDYETSFRVQHHAVIGQKNGTTTVSISSNTGTVTCRNLHCTGGTAEYTSAGIHITDNATSFRVQHHAVIGQNYGTTTISITSEDGKVTCQKLLCANEDGGYYDLASELSAAKANITTLWNAVFG